MSIGSEQRLNRVLDAVASSDGSMQSTIEHIRDSYGLRHMVYLGLNLPKLTASGPYVLVTYEQQWIDHYRDRNYVEIDPVVHTTLKSILPTEWRGFRDSTARRQRELFNEARLFGVGRNGLSIPIRGPRGELAVMSMTSDDHDDQWQLQVKERIAEFQVLAHHLHNKLTTTQLKPEDRGTHLAPREIEVLYWAGNGKSVSDIATILAISQHTVRTYLEIARARLNALNTTHAVARAVAAGLIRAPE